MSSSDRSKNKNLETLRVADQELASSKKQVFVQLSPGAVAFCADRSVAQARVSRQLRAAIDAEEASGAAAKEASKP